MLTDPTLQSRRAVADIVYAYRHLAGEIGKPLSLRAFSEAFSEILEPFEESISHQTVKNWEERVHLPRVSFFVLAEMASPPDWRRDFSKDILAALRPRLYQPATEIGRAAMERSLVDTGPLKLRYDNRWAQY